MHRHKEGKQCLAVDFLLDASRFYPRFTERQKKKGQEKKWERRDTDL